jgi:hypothetical protein
MSTNPNEALDPGGKISAAIASYAAANFHIFNIPSGKMAEMLSAAQTVLRGVKLADLSPGSWALTQAAQVGVAVGYGSQDPAVKDARRRDEAEKQAAGTGVVLDAYGHRNGHMPLAMAMQRGGDTGRANYQEISYTTSQSIQSITPSGYARTPFAEAGVNYGTFNYLRHYDRNFTGQDILNATRDIRQLGLNPNDKRAIRAQTTIDHYDNNKDATNAAIREYARRTKADEELNGWIRALPHATGKEREALLAKIRARRAEHRGGSGVDGRVADPKNHPKAKKEIPTLIEKVDEKRRNDLWHQKKNDPSSHQTDPTNQERRTETQDKDPHARIDAARDRERGGVEKAGIEPQRTERLDAMAAFRKRQAEKAATTDPPVKDASKSPGTKEQTKPEKEAKSAKPEGGDAKPEAPKKTVSAKPPDAGPKPG